MDQVTRRQAMGTAALSASGMALAATASAGLAQSAKPAVRAFAGQHTPKPLRYDPAKLVGLSERLITSPCQNNYQVAVRGLNLIETRLAAAMADADFPPVAYAGLKREELHRSGSVVLHECYFDALGGNGKPGGRSPRRWPRGSAALPRGRSNFAGQRCRWQADRAGAS